MRFEDKYGVLALVAAPHPEDRLITKTNQGVWDRLLKNASKKTRERRALSINVQPLKINESRL